MTTGTSFSTKRFSMSTASCHCGLFSIGSSSIFVLTLGFLAWGGWSDFFSPLPSSVVVWKDSRDQKSNHSTTLTQLLTASLKKSWFGWDFYLLSGDGLSTLPSFLILILHKTEPLTSISSFSRGFSSGSFGLSPWFCCSSWSVCILFWWTNTFGH